MDLALENGAVKRCVKMDKDGEPILNHRGKMTFFKIGISVELNSGTTVFYTFRSGTYTVHHSNGTKGKSCTETAFRRKYSPALVDAVREGIAWAMAEEADRFGG